MDAPLHLKHTVVAVETEHRVHVIVELTALAAPAAERAPLDVALVVDRSGSMGGQKLEAVKCCGAYPGPATGPAPGPAAHSPGGAVCGRGGVDG